MEALSGPTQFVILGGSGDLSKRKLLPALIDLYTKKALPERFRIIGLARTKRTNEEYRTLVAEAIKEHAPKHTTEHIAAFCEHIEYVSGSFTEASSYTTLKTMTDDYASSIGQCTNVLFYLAVPPTHYSEIFEQLHKEGFAEPCDAENGWTRILVEKPFGHDRASAQALDKQLCSLFKEEQIYRIDHYLAKEAIQNILSFRFANTLIKDSFSNHSVKQIDITMYETVDVESRGALYDGIGALRDVGQNHLLQLLAVMTMGEPSDFTAETIRKKRAEILRTLIPLTDDTIHTQFRRAQYAGYRDAKDVAPDSTTETAFCLIAYLSDNAWQGVPIMIETGKALKEKYVSVRVVFADIAAGPFDTGDCATTENAIVLEIEPHQTMHITLNAKAPGLGYQLESRTLSFACEAGEAEIKNSYERVLMDCIRGDQTLFVTGEEVVAQWTFINSILDTIEETELETYQPGDVSPFKD